MAIRSNRFNHARSISAGFAAGLLAASAGQARAQSFVPIDLASGMLEMRPLGIVAGQGGPVIPYKAINENGLKAAVQGGAWTPAGYTPMPDLYDGSGQLIETIPLGFRAQTIPGIDVIVKKKPSGKASVWHTTIGSSGDFVDLPDLGDWATSAWPTTINDAGNLIGGAVYGMVPSEGLRVRPVVWDNNAPQMLPAPADAGRAEVWGGSSTGDILCGVVNEGGVVDQPKLKPVKGSKGIIWQGGNFRLITPDAAGLDADGLGLTGMSRDGGLALATISSTRSNSKGGLYALPTDTFTRLDFGDLNSDGVIDALDDHDSSVLAISDDAGLVGGSMTIPGGPELAALWVRGANGYEAHLVSDYLSDLGVSLAAGWTLNEVTGVSGDGMLITGWGTSASGAIQGWYVTIPSPGSVSLLALGGLVAARRRR